MKVFVCLLVACFVVVNGSQGGRNQGPNGIDSDFGQKLNYNTHLYGRRPTAAPANINSGSQLRFIAEGSANEATNIVARQQIVARQAAFEAKNTLAQAAAQASQTAQVALAAKEAMLDELEKQSVAAQRSLEAEIRQLELAMRSAQTAEDLAIQTETQIRALETALSTVEGGAEQASQAVLETSAELESQLVMVEAAKTRAAAIEGELIALRQEFQGTQDAAKKAAAAAQAAQNNADAAGAPATEKSTQTRAETTTVAATRAGEVLSNSTEAAVKLPNAAVNNTVVVRGFTEVIGHRFNGY